MTNRIFVTLLLLIGSATAHAAGAALVITHVTVIDGTGAPAEADMNVVIEDGRIVALGKSTGVGIPEGAQVVEGIGKFLISGLIDMHVHTTWDPDFMGPLLLANGVTGVREMFARDLAAINRRRRDVTAGRTTGPRILAAGPIVDGEGAPWPHSIIVSDAVAARDAVDQIKTVGYDYVKVYSALNREAYFSIAAESRKQGIPYAGHVPDSVSAVEASNAGQRSFEHLYGISRACSTREAKLRTAPLSFLAAEKAELESFSEVKASGLFARLKKNGTWQVPTLVVNRNAALYSDPEYARAFANPSRLRYVPFALKTMWNLGLRLTPALSAGDLAVTRRYFEWQLHIVGEMQRAGVGILAGTDTPNPFVYPGFGLHDELALLVQAGLSPMEALQSATRNPAMYFNKLDSMGTIEKGKIADLDLLDANPLEDIHNTQRIRAVILGGKLLAEPELQALFAHAKKNRWAANPAALTLIGLLLHMMRKALLVTLLAIGAIALSVYLGRRQIMINRRSRKLASPLAR